MRQPHENENPGAAATASGQTENKSNNEIAPPNPADKVEHSAMLRAAHDLAAPFRPKAFMTPADKRSAWIQAARRRNEMIRVGIDRAGSGVAVDARSFAFAAAVTLASAPAGRFRVRGKFCTWHGLDGPALVDLLRKAKVAEVGCDDDLIGWTLGKVRPGSRLSPEAAGELLGLRAEERERLAVRSMESVDEPRIQREAREREQRKAKDRLRKARTRPWSKRHEESLARQEPWKEVGISRATWFRRRNETDFSAETNAETEISAETYSGRETDLSVRLKCPGTHLVKGEADRPVSPLRDAAPATHVWPSKPSTSIALGGGVAARQGAGGSLIISSLEAGSAGIRHGLADGCSSPESVSAKKEMLRLGRSVQTEDPRAKIIRLCRYAPDEIDLAATLVGRGDAERGFFLLAHLDEEFIRGLDERLGEAGAAGSELAIRAARSAALRLESLAVRRAAP